MSNEKNIIKCVMFNKDLRLIFFMCFVRQRSRKETYICGGRKESLYDLGCFIYLYI